METNIKPYCYNATIINVVDGDTVDARIDVGFKVYMTHRLRLLGVNTPELHDPDIEDRKKAQVAKEFLERDLLNKAVLIETKKADAFGRYLATIYLDGVNFNQTLIKDGYAVEFK
jgi:micrococcal nuclease